MEDNKLKISLHILSDNASRSRSTFEISGSLNIDGIKHIKLTENYKDELEKYIKNVFQYAKPLSNKNNYKYSDIIDYETYGFITSYSINYTLTEIIKAYVILSDEYNNTDWTNFCCNNVTGDFNIFCNNSTHCNHCINCNNCDNCIDCDYCNDCNDCVKCTKSNNCNTCNECTYVNSESNRYKINN